MSATIDEEIKDVKDRLAKLMQGIEIVGCSRAIVQIRVTRTPHKQLVVQFQFPDNYPNVPILIELKSKVFPSKVLDAVNKRCDEEAKKLTGKPQIISMVKFMGRFLEENPLLVCSEEVSFIKNSLAKESDDLRIKQKSGVISFKIVQNRYYLDLRITVPDQYPTECVSIDNKGSNFPKSLETHFIAQSKEIARQCVHPPLKKNPKAPSFEPKPSLKPVLTYLVQDCVRSYATESCQLCKKKALADNPEDNPPDSKNGDNVEWVYCGHLFHHSCLDTYMKTPPFTGGKKCPGCGKRIYHEKWNITPKLAEERWAHQEARKREIAEVADFLDL